MKHTGIGGRLHFLTCHAVFVCLAPHGGEPRRATGSLSPVNDGVDDFASSDGLPPPVGERWVVGLAPRH